MKKILSLILVLAMTFSLSTTALAADSTTSSISDNNTLKGEVDGNRPGAISFTSGSYGNHTVTYYGYNIYKKSGSSDKLYLRVNDNWGTSARYVDTTYIGSLGHTLFEICRVIP